ncbi:LysR family transcriptional regulator [Photobacterium makurazakiensis]|uniref:LysR family transcriptional regulator n=1 Tax=Photobacterium makurazakiensis TaxID=2910234 RepID=UPI003D12F9F0
MNKLKQTLSLDTVQILDVIEREGSFAAASQHLNRSTSALSYQIQKLEEDLDVLILDRSGHRATFTHAGRLLVEQGRIILDASDTLYKQVKELAQGWESDLFVSYDGIIGSDLFLSLMADFGQLSQTKLTFKEEILTGGWEALSAGRTDILVSSRPDTLPNEIKTTFLGKVEMIWVSSPYSPIIDEPEPLKENIRQRYRVIAVSDSAHTSPKLTKNILSDQSVYTVSTMDDKIKAIKAGIGIGTVPRSLIQQDLEQKNLLELGIAREVDIVVAWHRAEMGQAKTWCIKHIQHLWEQSQKAKCALV